MSGISFFQTRVCIRLGLPQRVGHRAGVEWSVGPVNHGIFAHKGGPPLEDQFAQNYIVLHSVRSTQEHC